MIRVRAATDGDHEAWQAFLAAHASRRFPARLGLGRCRRLRRPAAATLRRAEEDDEMVAIAAAQVRRLPLGRSFWYVPHGPVLDYDHLQAAERLRAMAIGLREAARRDRAIAVKLEPRLEAGSPPSAPVRQAAPRAGDAAGRPDAPGGAGRRRDDAGRLRQGHALRACAAREREGVAVTRTSDAGGPASRSTRSMPWSWKPSAAPASRSRRCSATAPPGAGWPAPVGPRSSRRGAEASCSPAGCW